MTTYLSLTPNQGPVQTLAIPSEENITLDLPTNGKPGQTRKVSFTRALDTPPETPPRSRTPKIITDQDVLPKSQSQLRSPDADAAASPTEGFQDHVATEPTQSFSSLRHSIVPASRLKHRIRDTNELIVCPGVYDGLSARIAMLTGHNVMYMVSLSLIGS